MENVLKLENFKNLTDEKLVDLLFIEKDTLPRAIVDEFVRRGERMIELLWDIIADTNNWQDDDNKWWAVIHATFILGAIGGKEVIIPLIMSLKFSDAYDYDWIWESLPSIFGKIGLEAIESLKAVALDRSNNWLTRGVALDGIAAVTIEHPELEKEIFDFIASIMNDQNEMMDVREGAGGILLDFKQKRYESSLLEFAEEQEEIEYRGFDREWVLEEFESDEKDLDQYIKDWLEFYDEEKIKERQKRWKKEKSLWYRLIGQHWEMLKFRIELRKITEPLPQIKLKYHKKKGEPLQKGAQCSICQKKDIVVGSIVDANIGQPKFICEECTIDRYQEEHGLETRKAAAARRRRMFDVPYLFEEMITDEYLKRHNLKSIYNLREEEFKGLLGFTNNEYNRLFSKREKKRLEEIRNQKQIEEKFKKIISLMKFNF